MIDNPDLIGSGATAGAGGLLGILAIKAWDWFFNRRTQTAIREAEATLIEGLTARITAVEARLATVESELAQERAEHLKTKAALFEAQSKLGAA